MQWHINGEIQWLENWWCAPQSHLHRAPAQTATRLFKQPHTLDRTIQNRRPGHVVVGIVLLLALIEILSEIVADSLWDGNVNGSGCVRMPSGCVLWWAPKTFGISRIPCSRWHRWMMPNDKRGIFYNSCLSYNFAVPHLGGSVRAPQHRKFIIAAGVKGVRALVFDFQTVILQLFHSFFSFFIHFARRLASPRLIDNYVRRWHIHVDAQSAPGAFYYNFMNMNLNNVAALSASN